MITFSCPYCGQKYEMEEDFPIENEIRCQVCNETFLPPLPDEKEKLLLKPRIQIKHPAPETVSRSANSFKPEPEEDTTDPYSGYGSLAGPWTRWGARTIDLTIETFVIALLLFSLEAKKIIDPLPSSLETAICFVSAFLIDSFIYAIFRNTIGKWLMGERIINEKMEKITFFEYFMRNIKVFLFGFGALIPVISLIAVALQYNRVSKGDPAFYDMMPGFSVVEYNKKWYKTLIGIVILLAIVAAILVNMMTSLHR